MDTGTVSVHASPGMTWNSQGSGTEVSLTRSGYSQSKSGDHREERPRPSACGPSDRHRAEGDAIPCSFASPSVWFRTFSPSVWFRTFFFFPIERIHVGTIQEATLGCSRKGTLRVNPQLPQGAEAPGEDKLSSRSWVSCWRRGLIICLFVRNCED